MKQEINEQNAIFFNKGVKQGLKHVEPSPITKKFMENQNKRTTEMLVEMACMRKDISLLLKENKETNEIIKEHVNKMGDRRRELMEWCKENFACKQVERDFEGVKSKIHNKLWYVVWVIAGGVLVNLLINGRDFLYNLTK
jgi:hypothetical protein